MNSLQELRDACLNQKKLIGKNVNSWYLHSWQEEYCVCGTHLFLIHKTFGGKMLSVVLLHLGGRLSPAICAQETSKQVKLMLAKCASQTILPFSTCIILLHHFWQSRLSIESSQDRAGPFFLRFLSFNKTILFTSPNVWMYVSLNLNSYVRILTPKWYF